MSPFSQACKVYSGGEGVQDLCMLSKCIFQFFTHVHCVSGWQKRKQMCRSNSFVSLRMSTRHLLINEYQELDRVFMFLSLQNTYSSIVVSLSPILVSKEVFHAGSFIATPLDRRQQLHRPIHRWWPAKD